LLTSVNIQVKFILPSCQVLISRSVLIFVVEARQRAEGRRQKAEGRREEDFTLFTFVDIPSFICVYLLIASFLVN
jgi:hypothetical protein